MVKFDYPDGATPIEPDEVEGLLLPHITNRSELNYWDQQNILEAENWAFSRRQRNLLSIEFIQKLHQKMFGTVWGWAGSFRRTGKNIGVAHFLIRSSLIELLEDVNIWIDKKTYSLDEIAIRFHHRLVFIHLFPNGNGRHARLMTDLFLVHVVDQRPFTWGSSGIVNAGECRSAYIDALKAADKHDYGKLLNFVRK